MEQKKTEEQQPNFLFTVSITVEQKYVDYRYEPNRLHYIFKTEFQKKEEFVQAVKYAVQDWISADPQSFAISVYKHGSDDLAAQPGEKGYLAAASTVEVNWKMVGDDMPNEIAIRHGFMLFEPEISIEADEHDSI